MIDSTSRYAGVPPLVYVQPGSPPIVYLSRRILPQGKSLAAQKTVTVQQNERDRIDLITARTLGQPELFWRIADANDAMEPFDLTHPAGLTLRVPVPQL